jgi:hypothetical protein
MARTRSQWIYCGLGLGIVTGFIVSTVQAVFHGWGLLDTQLVYNLLWSSTLGYFVGVGTCPVPKTKTPVEWRARLSLRALMVAVAVFGIILGIGIVTHRISEAARLYQQRANNSEQKARYFRSLAHQFENAENDALRKVEHLNPENLTPGQKDFLRTLDQGGSLESRMQRYKMMAESVEQERKYRHPFMIWHYEIAEYEEMVADKYRRATRRPWLPVATDPPEPPQPKELTPIK